MCKVSIQRKDENFHITSPHLNLSELLVLEQLQCHTQVSIDAWPAYLSISVLNSSTMPTRFDALDQTSLSSLEPRAASRPPWIDGIIVCLLNHLAYWSAKMKMYCLLDERNQSSQRCILLWCLYPTEWIMFIVVIASHAANPHAALGVRVLFVRTEKHVKINFKVWCCPMLFKLHSKFKWYVSIVPPSASWNTKHTCCISAPSFTPVPDGKKQSPCNIEDQQPYFSSQGWLSR